MGVMLNHCHEASASYGQSFRVKEKVVEERR